MPLELVTVPCLKDNYAFLAHDAATGATAVVDVPEAAPILNALAARDWKASHILITHHHDDHIAGLKALAAATGAQAGDCIFFAAGEKKTSRALLGAARVEIGHRTGLIDEDAWAFVWI
ncbi:MAG: MBL fold metallo-hydrolase, partial [Albidovulum sp.]